MPLIVKDFIWRQTREYVVINVPLKAVPPSKVDIFTSDTYIKASYPPFLFEVFLHSSINENNSKCTLSDDEIVFELHKTIPEEWESLTADIGKLEMLEKRKQILANNHIKAEEQAKVKKEKLATLQRLSVQQQIDRDTQNRKLIDKRRDTERNKAMEELEQWRETTEVSETKSIFGEKDVENNIVDEGRNECDINNSGDYAEIEIESSNSDPDEGFEQRTAGETRKAQGDADVPVFPMPLPRNTGKIVINFTPRDFPTPSRESQAQQEDEWLRKQMEARRASGFVAEDLRPEECNLTWLKDKGDSFYKVGNYLGAVSAYSHAIRLGFRVPSLYSNRAAAHIGLGNLHKALDDCSQALDLLTPKVDSNAEARARCHARRGAVLCRLKLPEAGLADFQEALKLRPGDPQLEADIELAKNLIKTKVPEEEETFDGIQVISH